VKALPPPPSICKSVEQYHAEYKAGKTTPTIELERVLRVRAAASSSSPAPTVWL